MIRFEIEIKRMGENAILIEWPERIDENILDDIIAFSPTVVNQEKDELINYTPGYNSLLLQYEEEVDYQNKKEMLINLYRAPRQKQETTFRSWHIPVCYDDEFAPDLSVYADRGLSKERIIQLHTSKPFRVYMIGFLPGFLYLGGLPEKLHMARKDTPRQRVEQGSIAIGGQQTGIYPVASPGGWQIIGRTPLSLFDIDRPTPTPIRQGDKIQFYPIDRKTFDVLARP